MSKATDAADARLLHRLSIIEHAELAMAAAGTQVEVVEIALRTVDLLAPTLPVGGRFAVSGAGTRHAYAVVNALNTYPKEALMSSTEVTPAAAPPSPALLAERNRADREAVAARIDELVAERLRINAEVAGLRDSLTALEAAGRHFAKHGLVPGLAPASPAPDDPADVNPESEATPALGVAPGHPDELR